MIVHWVNILFMVAISIFCALLASVLVVILDRFLDARRERREWRQHVEDRGHDSE